MWNMKLVLRLDPTRLRRSHVHLAERIAQRTDMQVSVEWGPGAEPLPSAISVLFALERMIYRLPAGDITSTACVQDFAKFQTTPGQADLVLDFTASEPPSGIKTWRLTFDGIADEKAALAALTQWRTPVVRIVDAVTGAAIVAGHPGTESAAVFTLAFGDVLARTATLVIAALDGALARQVEDSHEAAPLSARAVATFAAKSFARAIVSRLYHLCYNAPHWRTGWRFIDGADVIDLRTHPPGGWQDLPDDGSRFYADPFPFEHDGRLYLFVEDFAHALGYGVISVVEFDSKGPIGAPRPVLDTGSHLSYPFVFRHRDAIWMIPESGTAGTIDLYRAAAFPDTWVKETTLISGIVASDATLFEHNGRWWMLATVRDNGGAFSDALHVWSAPDIVGPWTPHRGNPVLVDIAAARPAGHVALRDGKLIRPFQDCRGGYGAALGLAEITRLDDETFEQRVETIMRAGSLWPGRRLHTLNRAGRLECIDGSGTARRF
jgi:hypothetical protein